MRTLLIPAVFLTLYAAAMITVGWTVTRGLQGADAAQGVLMIEPIAKRWFAWEDGTLASPGSERADEVGQLYY